MRGWGTAGSGSRISLTAGLEPSDPLWGTLPFNLHLSETSKAGLHPLKNFISTGHKDGNSMRTETLLMFKTKERKLLGTQHAVAPCTDQILKQYSWIQQIPTEDSLRLNTEGIIPNIDLLVKILPY